MSNRWEVAVNKDAGEQQFRYRNKALALTSYYNKLQYHKGNAHGGWYREEGLEVQLNDLKKGITLRSFIVGEGNQAI